MPAPERDLPLMLLLRTNGDDTNIIHD